MTEKAIVCPKCKKGHMRPSDPDKSQANTLLYECDNNSCKYKTRTYEQTYDMDSEPIVCTKCDIRFNTELEYKQHNDKKHKGRRQ